MPAEWRNFIEELSGKPVDPKHTAEATLVPLTQWSVLEFKGVDAAKFLQGQVTLDVQKLEPGRVAYGGYCNLKGRLHSLFYLSLAPQQENTFWMILPRDNLNHALTTFKKYALFSKVAINAVMVWPMIGLVGKLSEKQTANIEKSTEHQEPITRLMINEQRSLVLGSESALLEVWQQLSSSCSIASESIWNWSDIQEGRAFVHTQTLETFLPHYVGLIEHEGVDFNKGCYLGQEIIARMQYKGHIKRHLALASLTSKDLPEPGTEVLKTATQENVGQVISAAHHQGETIVLVTLQDDAIQQDLELNYPENSRLKGLTSFQDNKSHQIS